MANEKVAQTEKAHHLQAFDSFYNQGPKRKNAVVAKKMGVTQQTVCVWRKNFNWDERIKEKEEEDVSKIIKKTGGGRVKTGVEHRETVRRCLNIMKAMINDAVEVDEAKEIIKVVISPLDWRRHMESLSILMKMDLLLIGEPTEREETIFVMEVVGVDINKFPEPFDVVTDVASA